MSRVNPAARSKSKFFSHFSTSFYSVLSKRLSSISLTLAATKPFKAWPKT
jgi:hypothetical protein